jgi:hypothetical protein
MQRNDALTRQTVRFSWHLASIFGCAYALILSRLANRAQLGPGDRLVIRIMAVSLVLCAAFIFAMTRGRHPGWAAFLATAALCWKAVR